MIRQGSGGKQIHIGSVRTLRARGYAAYCATKGGGGPLQAIGCRMAAHGINVNVVAPTFVRTQQVAALETGTTLSAKPVKK